ncbi:hypothetical protein [Neptunicella sp. SCSIO 80796]|uniref:hypothetical protein n=1 Tax=Neptunicella plasticusilytica TaxID=3117012 RepID=UPI003A4DF09E
MQWIELLNAQVEKRGRRQVETDLNISKTTLSQLLNNKYPGSLENIEHKVIAAYSNQTVSCPVLGEIPLKRCDKEQNLPFSISSPQRVRLYRACLSCPNKRRCV